MFDWLAEQGGIEIDEMRRTFNCGVGMIVAIDASDEQSALAALSDLGETAWRIGQIEDGAGPVEYL